MCLQIAAAFYFPSVFSFSCNQLRMVKATDINVVFMQLTYIFKERTGLEVLIPSTECRRRPCQKRKCKEVPAQSTDSEQTVPCFTRIRGQTRRRGTGNGTDQGKLNSSLLNNYLG